jgi:predicted RNase H-like HicB family nuclease
MEGYLLKCAVYDPSESTEPDMYMAEIPALPGCTVWEETETEALETLRAVAADFIATRIKQGYGLPDEVTDSLITYQNSRIASTPAPQVLVAV